MGTTPDTPAEQPENEQPKKKRFGRRKNEAKPRTERSEPASKRKRRKGSTEAPAEPSPNEPLPAPASFEGRLAASAYAATDPGPGFVVENGTVEPSATGGKRVRRRSRLAGGRWRRHVLLVVMLLALTVLVVNGVYRLAGKALYDPPQPKPGDAYPAAQASGYAARFAHVYLTWDQANPESRSDQLKIFFPQGTDTQLGWDGRGVQRVVGQPLPSGVTTRDDNRAVVHIAALIEPGGWTCMDVAVYAANGGAAFAITSYAAFLSCPVAAAANVPAESRQNDGAAATEMMPTINSFFRAYGASSPDLTQVVTPDSGITGLRGSVILVDVTRVFVPIIDNGEDTNERTAEARVRWRTPSSGAVVQTYRLAMRKIGGRWFVHRIDGGVESADVAPANGGVPPLPSRSPSSSTQPNGQSSPSTSGSASAGGSASPSGN